MKRLIQLVLLLLLVFHLNAQTITVGTTTTQLTSFQRGSVASVWPDGTMSGINHGGVNYIFAPTTNPGTVAISLANLNTWSSGLSVVNGSSGNISLGGSGAFDQNYAGGGAVYDDTAVSGFYFHLYHGEQWFGGSGSPFYAALGLAYSNSLTGPWTKLGEVISPQSARVNGGANCQAETGVGELMPVGSYFYAYYTDTATGCVSLGIAVARASISAVRAAVVAGTPFTSGPGTLFMKYTGSGTWTGDGVTDLANPQNGGGAFTKIVTDSGGAGSYIPNVRYNSASNSYIMVYSFVNNANTTSQINAQTSTDGLSWGNQQTLVTGGSGFPPGGTNMIYYPTLLNTSGGDPDTLGANFSVFYVKPFGTWSGTALYSTALSVPAGGGGCTGTGPYVCTAASAAESDVNAVINGPTHTAGNGDTIQIPCSGSNSVTWASTLTVTASITITALGGTPNSGTGTFGAGTNCLTITSTTSVLFELDPTYASSNNVVTLQNMTLVPGSGAYTPIHISGTGTSSGMPLFHVDNIGFGNSTTQWQYGTGTNTGEFGIIANNVFGQADHNTSPTGSHFAFISVNLTAYLGVGQYGDNSWAQPDSTGGPQNIFIENNQLYQGLWPIVENEQDYPSIGGGRAVTRFNHVTASGIFFLTGGHGNDTDGRPRSMRTNETYGNTVNCVNDGNGNACYDFVSFRGGSGLTFGNTATLGSGAVWNEIGSLATYRIDGDGWAFSNVGSCGGATSGNAYGPFDQNDGTTYYSGTFTSGTSGVTLVASGSPGWTTNQWSNPSPFYPYSVWDVTQGWVSIVESNGSNTLSVSQAPHGYINGSTAINAASGDSFQITRSKSCLDGGARGAGLLLQNQPAVLASTGSVGPANEVLDPVYEWNDTVPAVHYGDQFGLNYSPPAQLNREVFTDNSLGSPHVQTSPTSPFNGSSGVGFGTLANRPTTCTTNSVSGAPGTGYFAIDQGSWNTSGNGFGQGVLYKCTATNTWTASYTPYVYPYSFSASTITGVSVSCSPSSITTSQTSTCTSTVTGTGSFSSAVTWTATNGTVNSGGLYTPNSSGAPFTGVVTATSVQNSSFSGSANVSVTAPPPSLTTVVGATIAGHVQ